MNTTIDYAADLSTAIVPPAWMVDFIQFRKRLFLQTVEPVILTLLGPMETKEESSIPISNWTRPMNLHVDEDHRRLNFLPNYVVQDANSFRETSMSFATLIMLFVIMSCLFLIFLSCFYHNQKTSPLFISPRRHRLPKLVPPPLPIDGYFDWVSKKETNHCSASSRQESSPVSVSNTVCALLFLFRSKYVSIFRMRKSFNVLATTRWFSCDSIA
jgi:hypothetical protein